MSNFHGPTLVNVVGGVGSLRRDGRSAAVLAAEGDLAISGAKAERTGQTAVRLSFDSSAPSQRGKSPTPGCLGAAVG